MSFGANASGRASSIMLRTSLNSERLSDAPKNFTDEAVCAAAERGEERREGLKDGHGKERMSTEEVGSDTEDETGDGE